LAKAPTARPGAALVFLLPAFLFGLVATTQLQSQSRRSLTPSAYSSQDSVKLTEDALALQRQQEHAPQNQDPGDDAGGRLNGRGDRRAGCSFLQRRLRVGDPEKSPSEERDGRDRGEKEAEPCDDEDHRENPPKPSARNDRGVGPASGGAHP